MANQTLTQKRLKEVLDYNPDTGTWLWRVTRGRAKAGNVAGSVAYVQRYRRILVDSKLYLSGRLAFLYMTGAFPEFYCDHINHVRDDDRWDNLREVNAVENNKNTSMRSDNTSGRCGVTWHKRDRKWQATIKINRKTIYLGQFNNFNDAVAAREVANTENEFHRNHGR